MPPSPSGLASREAWARMSSSICSTSGIRGPCSPPACRPSTLVRITARSGLTWVATSAARMSLSVKWPRKSNSSLFTRSFSLITGTIPRGQVRVQDAQDRALLARGVEVVVGQQHLRDLHPVLPKQFLIAVGQRDLADAGQHLQLQRRARALGHADHLHAGGHRSGADQQHLVAAAQQRGDLSNLAAQPRPIELRPGADHAGADLDEHAHSFRSSRCRSRRRALADRGDGSCARRWCSRRPRGRRPAGDRRRW